MTDFTAHDQHAQSNPASPAKHPRRRQASKEIAASFPKAGRLLAWSTLAPAGIAGADHQQLLVTHPHVAIDWWQILGAAWNEPTLTLRVAQQQQLPAVFEAELTKADLTSQVDLVAITDLKLHLQPRTVLAQVAKERIMQSIVMQHKLDLVGDKGVRMLARRQPDTSQTWWQVLPDAGIDLANPGYARATAVSIRNSLIDFGV